MITRRKAALALTAGVMSTTPTAIAAAPPCDISIRVDEGPTVIISIPNVQKDQLVEIIATFFTSGPHNVAPAAREHLRQVLNGAKNISMVVSNFCPDVNSGVGQKPK